MNVASAEDLIGRAVSETGLSNFGADGWREGLSRLVASMSEMDFAEKICTRVEKRLVGVLASRLRIEDWFTQHPGAASNEIAGPVFIIGLPRTATSALLAFLANDPQWRYLRGWEAAAPTPPPDIATEQNDPRRLAEHQHLAGSAVGQNQHIQEAGGPVDDAALLRLDFRNQELGWPAWSYTRWWRDCDMRTAYAYHARALKLLQNRRPPNAWLVKAPWHNFHVDALTAQYPNAKLVMCHRDPVMLIASVASLLKTSYRALTDEDIVPPEALGRFVLEHLTISIKRVMDFRKSSDASAPHASRFIDVQHQAFNADPFGTVEDIYARLGKTLPPTVRTDMQAWLQRNRKGAHGEHSYSLEEFGLNAPQVRDAFAEYIDEFGLA